MHIDPYLRHVPQDFPVTSSTYDFPTLCLINFMFVRFHVHQLSAATILTYCAGIKFTLKVANVDTSYFQSFVTVMARSALSLMCRQRVAKSESSRLPFTLDLILRYKDMCGLLTYRAGTDWCSKISVVHVIFRGWQLAERCSCGKTAPVAAGVQINIFSG